MEEWKQIGKDDRHDKGIRRLYKDGDMSDFVQELFKHTPHILNDSLFRILTLKLFVAPTTVLQHQIWMIEQIS